MGHFGAGPVAIWCYTAIALSWLKLKQKISQKVFSLVIRVIIYIRTDHDMYCHLLRNGGFQKLVQFALQLEGCNRAKLFKIPDTCIIEEFKPMARAFGIRNDILHLYLIFETTHKMQDLKNRVEEIPQWK